jgi:hypothetical protein
MSIQKQTYNLASNSDAHQYLIDAKDWYNYQRGNENFAESGGIVVRALAEYMANQSNRTLFKSKQ